MANDDLKKVSEAEKSSGVTRREFIKYSAGTAAILSLGLYGCGNSSTSENSPVGTTSSEPVFFVHISDSHFGGETLLGEGGGGSQDPVALKVIPKALMTTLINEIVPVVDPLATIHTGDLVNEGYQLKPWQSYRDVFANTSMKYPKNYIEIPGNHDAKTNNTTTLGRDVGDGRQLFTQYSVIGQVLGHNGDKFGLTELASPSGTVRLIRTNTAESPTNNNRENIAGYFPAAQQQSLLNDLSLSQPAMLSVVLGHHPIEGKAPIAAGNDRMKEIVAKSGAPIYLCGHVHVPDTMWSGNTLVVQAGTFGRWGEPSSFYLVAYDGGVAAAKLVTINATEPFVFGWPLVFITSPANATLGGSNPNATPFTPDQRPKLRAMVFSPDATNVRSVQYSVDGGDFNQELINAAGRLWEAPLDLQGLSRGPHAVTVRATLSHGQIGIDTISITVS